MNTEKEIIEEFKDGEKVVICDGMNTGIVGVIGGHKGKSIAVCFDDNKDGHDCDGLCPSGGTYEPKYALLSITLKNKQAIDLLISHYKQEKQALKVQREKIIEEIRNIHFEAPKYTEEERKLLQDIQSKENLPIIEIIHRSRIDGKLQLKSDLLKSLEEDK